MAFNPGIAYGLAIVTALALTYMGAKNRQSGWRKERTNGVLDIFMSWAQANQQLRHPAPRVPASLGPTELGDQLAALTFALNVNAGASLPKPGMSLEPISAQQDTKIMVDGR